MKDFFQNLKAFFFSRHFLKHLGLIVLLYVSIIFTLMIYLRIKTNHGEKIEVPNLIGKNAEEAKVILQDLGLAFQILDSVYDPSKPAGTIVSQSPSSTAISSVFVKTGRTISLRVTKKFSMVEMPSLVHKQALFAQQVLASRNLKCTIEYVPSDEANGSVIEQFYKGRPIKEGVRIPVGSTIKIRVGENDKGKPVLIPDLLGLDAIEIQNILEPLGFSYSKIFIDCFTNQDSLNAKCYIQSPEYIEGEKTSKSTNFTLQFKNEMDTTIVIEEQ